jgi:hypothetical protein
MSKQLKVFKNVVRGFSPLIKSGVNLVLHDPKGSHYKNLEVNSFKNAKNERKNKTKQPPTEKEVQMVV